MSKENLYTRAQKAYQEGTPIMSDIDFDALEAELLSTDKVIGLEGKVKLPIRMWSMIKDPENKLIEITKGQVIVQFKIDGVALLLHYKYGNLFGAYTRGDGEYGQSVNHHLYPQSPDIPLSIPINDVPNVYIIGEAYMDINDASTYEYKNARNGVAGILNNQEYIPASRSIRFFAFDITYNIDTVDQAEFSTEGHKLRVLRDNDFMIPPTFATFDKAMLKAKDRKELPYLIDGLVIKVLNAKAQQFLSYTERAPKFYSCFKFIAESDFAVLQKIEWNVGRTGQIVPLAHFTPIDIGGSTIRKATLHSYSMVKNLGIAIGDKLKIVKAGDIIPQIDQIIERSGNDYEENIASVCPSCKSVIQLVGEHAKCVQPRCKDKIVAQITYAAKTIGLKGLGPAKAKALYEQFRDDAYIAASCIQEAIDKGMVTVPQSISMAKVIQAFNTYGIGQAGAKQAVAGGKKIQDFVPETLAEKLHLMLVIV